MKQTTSVWVSVLAAVGTLALVSRAEAAAEPPRPPRQADGIPPRAPGQEQDAPDARQRLALQTLQSTSEITLAARFRDGQPRFLRGRIPVSGDGPVAMARDFFNRFGRDLWRLGPNSELRLLRTDPETGFSLFAQRYRGLRVIGGQVGVLAAAGAVHAAQGSLLAGDGLDTTPVITEEGARAAASADGARVLAPPRLVVDLRPGRRLRSQRPYLAWSVPVGGGRFLVRLIDARTGLLARESPLEMDSAASEDEFEADFFDVHGHSVAKGEGCQEDSENADRIGDDDGLIPPYNSATYSYQAWFHSRRAYTFYYDHYGRFSYDGSDGPVEGFINSSWTDNGMWSSACEEISWAPGYGGSDTPVHEFTHGVTQFTSGLEYQDECGALNESFSDVMAAIADPENDWLHGEDNLGGGPIRSLRNPPDEGQPDRYVDFVYTDDDDGGVHTNSGIPNKAAFLLSEGETFNGRTVVGVGRHKAGKLLYKAYTNLTQYSEFEDLRDMAVAVALLWAVQGWHNFTLADVCSARNAYGAVGIGKGDNDCDGVEDPADPDDDNDGVPGGTDNCPLVANPAQTDADHDSEGDACDADDDGDDVPDVEDNCPSLRNADQADSDFNGMGDLCEDPDGDGIVDTFDNCPDDFNPDQKDSNGDGQYGDACDPDPDGDGVPASSGDNCPLVANADQADSDGDFYGDACDQCPNDADATPAFGFNGQPLQPDSDGDGVPDECDTSILIGGRTTADGLSVSREPRPGTLAFDQTSRLLVPIALCPEPCAEEESSPLAGTQFDLSLAGLATGVTAMVVDASGQSWARSATLPDGTRLLRFAPQAGREYFLTFQAGAGAPSSSSFEVRSFLPGAPPPPTTDVAVSVSDDPDPALEGDTVSYAVQVRNDGFAAAIDVTLTASVPAHTALLSAEGCTPAGAVLLCPLGALAGGQGATRQIVVRVEDGFAGTVALAASVASLTGDPEPGNNAETEETSVGRRVADLALRLGDSPDPVTPGQRLTYALRVENLGAITAEHVVIADSLPDGVDFVSATGDRGPCTHSDRVVVCAGGSLASGQASSVAIVVDVRRNARPGSVLVDLAATASLTSEVDYTNNVTREETTVGPRQ